MSSEKWDVGIDLDGCAYDFVDAMRRETNILMPHLNTASEALSWTFYESWGLSTEDFLEVYAHGVVNGRVLWEGDPFPGTQDAWHTIAEAGHRIHVITDRRPPGAEKEAQAATFAWLANHGLPYDSITFSPDKTLIRSFVASHERTVFVDDKYENHIDLQKAGIKSFLMDRPWNQHGPAEPRVANLPHYAQRVAEISGRPLALA